LEFETWSKENKVNVKAWILLRPCMTSKLMPDVACFNLNFV